MDWSNRGTPKEGIMGKVTRMGDLSGAAVSSSKAPDLSLQLAVEHLQLVEPLLC